ncbi:ferredoxin [Sphaerimonospora cavernae]|uniref:Ferredoxin n=1 Tax=Sphaerimonospora cavernae TaxID=1740611 RepID=A0ABV6U1Q2_9ACTN
MTVTDPRMETQVGWKVTLDQDVCQGYACCVMAVPSVFDLDDGTGKAIVINPEPDASLRSAVEGAARGCPVHAIKVEAR